ncbi:MAG: hypothetical protein K1Y36_16385, partial [Blastocatellia bacterium]|nr:hypothetical protein [Blastocatellia bacterium]
EKFASTDNPDSQITSGIAFSLKSGKFYVAGMDGDTQRGVLQICDNNNGNYRARVLGGFQLPQGTPTGIAVVNNAKGDTVIVASSFFTGDDYFGTSQTFTLTAYPPNAEGQPDGKNAKVLASTSTLMLGGSPVNFSLGGLAVDSKNNLYVQVGNAQNNTVGGAIVVFTDSDADGVPDKLASSVFAAPSNTDPIPNVASSISVVPLPSGGNQFYVYGPIRIFGATNTTRVVVYTDADGDLKADGAPKNFISLPSTQVGFVLDGYGPTASIVTCPKADFQNGVLGYCYLTLNGNNFSGATVSFAKDKGDGTAGPSTAVFEGPKAGNGFGFPTFVNLGPTSGDTTPPTVKVTAPNGGETAKSGTQLAITWQSSDDKALASHDVSLSNDGGSSFPFVVATGLAATAQSFNYSIPGALETPNARVRVTAKDSGGNSASDTSDADFTIVKSDNVDSVAPTVSVTAPTAGTSLTGGTKSTARFTSTDNVGVVSHAIAFASDGTNFTTTLASGLPGTANSFEFTVPSVATTNGAIRVQAADAAGNVGSATSGRFTVTVPDSEKPTVTVTSPGASTTKITGGSAFNVTWTSRDNIGIASHQILLSKDDGATFPTTLAASVAGTAQSFSVTIPNEKIKKGKIKVTARDAAGNTGEGVSTTFKVKQK